MEGLAILALLPILAVFAGVAWGLWKLFQGFGWLLGRLFRLVGLLLRRVGGFVRTTLVDAVQTVGALVTAIAIAPLAIVNLAIGRWSASRHYGRALEDELASGLLGLYRVSLGNPLRFLGLGRALDGLDRRLPDLVDRAPRRARGARSRSGAHTFPGYDVVGGLPRGGSGAELFLARPRPETLLRFRESGRPMASEVAIKAFALSEGSTLPQIVRESRALEAAGRLGLVYEHRLDDQRFYYVMPFVRGEGLDEVVRGLHRRSGAEGLGEHELALAVGYAQDLLRTLDRFHGGGLWHKDVKPANVIVSGDRAHLVDFGLVTPLTSAMTLTTHGTEYYRDPEMVRLAMQGVKVHEVDGVKFDLYSAGALLYSMIEDSFPAHGSLSRITKRCPEALEWVVRRAMAESADRYASAGEMLADLEAIAAASDPLALLPAELPSFGAARTPSRASEQRGPTGLPDGWEDLAAASPLLSDAQPDASRGPGSGSGHRRGRMRRFLGAAAVVMLFGMVAVGAAGEIFGPDRRPGDRHEIGVTFAALEASRLRAGDRDALRDAQRIVDEIGVEEDVYDTLAEQWRERLADVLPAPRPSGRETGVLLLEDGTGGATGETVAALEHMLAEHGFDVLGQDTADDEELLLVAEARHAVGLEGPGDAEAVGRLQRYLDRQARVDAILWIAPCDEGDCHVYRVLKRRPVELAPPEVFSPSPSLSTGAGADDGVAYR